MDGRDLAPTDDAQPSAGLLILSILRLQVHRVLAIQVVRSVKQVGAIAHRFDEPHHPDQSTARNLPLVKPHTCNKTIVLDHVTKRIVAVATQAI